MVEIGDLTIFFYEALTSLRFFVLANTLFSSSLSSNAPFGGGAKSGIRIAVKGITSISFSDCSILSRLVSMIDSVKTLGGMMSREDSEVVLI